MTVPYRDPGRTNTPAEARSVADAGVQQVLHDGVGVVGRNQQRRSGHRRAGHHEQAERQDPAHAGELPELVDSSADQARSGSARVQHVQRRQQDPDREPAEEAGSHSLTARSSAPGIMPERRRPGQAADPHDESEQHEASWPDRAAAYPISVSRADDVEGDLRGETPHLGQPGRQPFVEVDVRERQRLQPVRHRGRRSRG